MALGVSQTAVQREVTVVSSEYGPPRLELTSSTTKFGRFSSFGDDGDLCATPRTKSSPDILNDILRRESSREDLPEKPRGRARDEYDRPGLNDLITFLRNVSPPPQNYMSSAFDEAETGSDHGKWMLLKKLRRKRTRSDSPIHRTKTKLPDSAVAAYTTGGHAHIAISIPLEHCHLGPETTAQLAVYNATPPLPPSPPLNGDEIETTSGPVRPFTGDRVVTVLKTVAEDRESVSSTSRKGSTSQAPPNRPHASVSLWPHTAPISPPRSPTTTAPDSPVKLPRISASTGSSLPMNPDDYLEIPNTSTPTPKTQEDNAEARRQKAYLSWMTTSGILQPAPAPSRHSTGKGSEHRPDKLNLPVRKSSTSAVSGSQPQSQSIDGLISVQNRHLWKLSGSSQLSPSAFSDQSIADSVVTNGTEPVVENARSVRGYSNVPIVTRTPLTTPRHSVLLGVDQPAVTVSDFAIASRKSSTKTTSSRAERVRELRQRDVEKARVKKQHQPEMNNSTTDRPGTSESVVIAVPRQSTVVPRTVQPEVNVLERFPMPQDKLSNHTISTQAKEPTEAAFAPLAPLLPVKDDINSRESPTTVGSNRVQRLQEASHRLSERRTSVDEANPVLNGTDDFARGSIVSSEPPRRFGSYHRTSWASSIPLLDRISSYAPSEGGDTRLLGSVDGELVGEPETKTDSASLSGEDRGGLSPLGLCISESDRSRSQTTSNDLGAVTEQFSFSRLTEIMPVVEIQPLAPPDERWSGSTLSTPMPALQASPPMPIPRATAGARSSEPLLVQSTRRRQQNELSVPLDRVSLARRREWNAERERERRAHATSEEGSPIFASLAPEIRRSHALLRMSTRELLNHYESIRGERMTDLAHTMLERQQMLELSVRRQERNTAVFHQILERILDIVDRRLPATPYLNEHFMDEWANEDLSDSHQDMRGGRFELRTLRRTGRLANGAQMQQGRPHRRIIESSEEADSSLECKTVEAPERRRRRQHVVGATGLDGLEPVMRELQGATRLSLESPRERDTSLDEDPVTLGNMF